MTNYDTKSMIASIAHLLSSYVIRLNIVARMSRVRKCSCDDTTIAIPYRHLSCAKVVGYWPSTDSSSLSTPNREEEPVLGKAKTAASGWANSLSSILLITH